MLDKRLDELKLTGALPSPTGVGLSILQMTQGDDYAMGDITRVIQSDPALTGRIILLANGAARTGLEAVTTVSEAAMRLGVRTVRNVALSFTLVNGNRKGGCAEFDYQQYWSLSLATAVAARALAAELRSALPADAFTCGLLSGIGGLALASIHPEKYSEMMQKAAERNVSDLVPIEREVFDLDHCQLAGAMLRDWKLPESFAYAVSTFERDDAPTDAPDEVARNMSLLLRKARSFAHACLGRDPLQAFWRADAPELAEVRARVPLDDESFERLGAVIYEDWKEWGKILEISTSEIPGIQEVAQQAAEVRRAEAASESPSTRPERKGLRILAVDDDAVSLRLLEHHLTRDGHTVIKAINGRQALIAALESNPQMVVTDWMMPEMDGIELCKALRRANEGRGMYLLLLTGREDEDRVVEAFHAGADEYVVKPFNPKILLARVRAGQRMIELREQVELDRRERAKQVAEMAVLNRKYQAAAMTDVLTRLPNRRYAMRRLDEEVSNARRNGSPLSVIMIDIDHFKAVNDQFGHDLGDLVLRETAGVLKRMTRKGDVVCRLGGEEFLVICAKCDLDSCASTAERIRAAVEENLIGFGYDRNVTVSLGVATLGPETTSVDALLKAADLRVYTAKALGRNQVCFEDPGQDQSRAG